VVLSLFPPGSPQPLTLDFLPFTPFETKLDAQEVQEFDVYSEQLLQPKEYSEASVENLETSRAPELEEEATPEEAITVEEGKHRSGGLKTEARVGGVKREAPGAPEGYKCIGLPWQAQGGGPSSKPFKRERITEYKDGVV